MNTLYADIALAMCGSLAFGIRAMIEGERFDRALHRVDATYMNLRDMARCLVADPSDAAKDLARAYRRYYGIIFRPVEDVEVERLRRRTVRAFVEYAIFLFGGIAAVFVVGALLRRMSTTADVMVVVSVITSLLVYWAVRLVTYLRTPDRSVMICTYMLGGVVAAVAALLFVLIYSTRT